MLAGFPLVEIQARPLASSFPYQEGVMKELWDQFERWLRDNWPDGLSDLNPPATDEEIEELERELGVRLPEDFIACLKVHNGQKNLAGGLFGNSEFLSTREIFTQWKIWKSLLDSNDFQGFFSEPAPGIRNEWWNPRWIPFTHNGGGDHLCLDLDTASEGNSGQVITMWHDMGTREIQGVSFQSWFAGYVKAVLAGQYAYSDDYGGLVEVNITLPNCPPKRPISDQNSAFSKSKTLINSGFFSRFFQGTVYLFRPHK